MYFDELDLEPEILDGLDAMNFQTCTPVQEQTIPVIMQGRDVISCAQTGTGKTAAYILPLLNNLLIDNHDPHAVNAVIMAPTRELAGQIDQQMEGFSYFVPLSSVAVYGGNDARAWDTQRAGLKNGADIVIATPGRLLSHLNLGTADLSKVKYFILDEADRMLDMGFFDDIMLIVKALPKERQTILFSATMPTELRKLAKTFMHNPVEVNIAISRPPETIRQMAYYCYPQQKIKLIGYALTQLLDTEKLSKVIIFAGKKQTVKDLAYALKTHGIQSRAMHSDLEQKERDEVMLDFRNGKIDVLVATDIVSRGIDVDDIPLVINFDVPRDAEDYVHRIGRTARAENLGAALTLVSPDDLHYFDRIEAFLKKEVEMLPIPEEFGEAPERVKAAQYTAKKKKNNWRSKKRKGGSQSNRPNKNKSSK